MSPLRDTEDKIDWKLVALLASVPLVFATITSAVPEESPNLVRWSIFVVALGLKLGCAYIIVRKSLGGGAMMHGFLVGAGSVLLVGIMRLLSSPIPFSFGVIPGFIPAMLFGGLWMVVFVWVIEKFRDWLEARANTSGQSAG